MVGKLGVCDDCGQLRVLIVRNKCKKCYTKWYYHNSRMSRLDNTVGGEEVKISIERDLLNAKDATKYINFKRKQILDDAIRYPSKYLKRGKVKRE